MLECTKQFLRDCCYENVVPLIDDTIIMRCLFCRKEGWAPGDIVHKRTCELSKVLTEIRNVEKKHEKETT